MTFLYIIITGRILFSAFPNHGAQRFFAQKNHGVQSFFALKNHGANTFFDGWKYRLTGPVSDKSCQLPNIQASNKEMELNTVVYVKVKVGLNHDVLSRTFLVGLHRVPFRTSSLRRTKDSNRSLNIGPILVSTSSLRHAKDDFTN